MVTDLKRRVVESKANRGDDTSSSRLRSLFRIHLPCPHRNPFVLPTSLPSVCPFLQSSHTSSLTCHVTAFYHSSSSVAVSTSPLCFRSSRPSSFSSPPFSLLPFLAPNFSYLFTLHLSLRNLSPTTLRSCNTPLCLFTLSLITLIFLSLAFVHPSCGAHFWLTSSLSLLTLCTPLWSHSYLIPLSFTPHFLHTLSFHFHQLLIAPSSLHSPSVSHPILLTSCTLSSLFHFSPASLCARRGDDEVGGKQKEERAR